MTEETAALSSLVLPEGGGWRRDHILPEKNRLPDSDRGYDFTTLIYDAIWLEAEHVLLLVCPKLLNFEALIGDGGLSVDGRPLGLPRIRRFRRYDEVRFDCPRPPGFLKIEAPGLSLLVPVSRQSRAFAGQDVLMTLSKDNPLPWVRDWVLHHVEHHGATAVLFYDNGSTAYHPDALRELLAGLPGLAAFSVIEVPFLYGNIPARRHRHRAKFLQTSLINIARHRFLHDAAGVLSNDIDEIVVSRRGQSVFEAARKSPLRYVCTPGHWRFARPEDGRMPMHADHIWRADPDRTSAEKWCVVPDSFLGRGSWDVHGVRRYAFNWLAMSRDQIMLHCENISTGWKRPRDADKDFPVVRDPLAEGLWGG